MDAAKSRKTEANMRRFSATHLLFVLAFGSTIAGAQEALPHDLKAIGATEAPLAEAFGGDVQLRVIPITDFVPGQSGYSYDTSVGQRIHPTAPETQDWLAPLGLPPGAAIEEIRALVRDDDGAEDIAVRLHFLVRSIDGSGTCDAAYYNVDWAETSQGLSGHGTVVLQGSQPWIVRAQGVVQDTCASETYIWYSVWVQLRSTSHSLTGAVVRWRRTVSDAPSAATFNDVPTSHPFFQFIEALSESGITAGCGGGNYCPDNPLTRGQMAVFLAKALGLHWPL
jgi:hypothetical protein